jgi:hypothetical protein
MSFKNRYMQKCVEISDINEHLPTLFNYASDCQTVTECGVRSVTSSYAFAAALQPRENTRLIQVDTQSHPNIDRFQAECKVEGLASVFYGMSDLECPLEQTDLLFIDTWHVYGQLKRELERWHTHVRNYIILHDTTVDEWEGETIRNKWDAVRQSMETGIPIHEIRMGLWPAVTGFLAEHRDWVLHERYTNNNGLTILKRSDISLRSDIA